MASTASRVGEAAISRAAGWQLVAANVGAISVPAIIGVLVDGIGPGVTPVILGLLALSGLLPIVWASRRALEPSEDTLEPRLQDATGVLDQGRRVAVIKALVVGPTPCSALKLPRKRATARS